MKKVVLIYIVVFLLVIAGQIFSQENKKDRLQDPEKTAVGDASKGKDLSELDNAIKKVQDELTELRDEALREQQKIQEERLKLLEEIEVKEKEYKSNESALKSERKLAGELSEEISKNKDKSAELEEILKEYAQITTTKAKDLSDRLDGSIIGHSDSNLVKESGNLCDIFEEGKTDYFNSTKELFDIAKKEIVKGSSTQWFKQKVIAEGGYLIDAEILRIGEIVSFCVLPNGSKGMLVRAEDGKNWRMFSSGLGYFQQRNIENFLERMKSGSKEFLSMPIDITGGLALSAKQYSMGLSGYFKAGGICMYPLLIIAIIGILIVIERSIILALIHLKTGRLMSEVEKLCLEGKFQDAQKLCEIKRSPLGYVLKVGLLHKDAPKDLLEDGIKESILHQLPKLERFLSTVGVLAVIAPLLGLLGTITGLFAMFSAITLYGTGDPRLLAGGISEALITTVAGLVIAIPLLLFHSFISGRIGYIISDLEASGTKLINIFSKLSDPSERTCKP